MKKRIWISVYVLAALVFIGSAYVASQKPLLRVDRCSAQVIFLKGGYRSWGADYCYGFQPQPDGTEKHHYHRPRFFHVDIRHYLKDDDK